MIEHFPIFENSLKNLSHDAANFQVSTIIFIARVQCFHSLSHSIIRKTLM